MFQRSKLVNSVRFSDVSRAVAHVKTLKTSKILEDTKIEEEKPMIEIIEKKKQKVLIKSYNNKFLYLLYY